MRSWRWAPQDGISVLRRRGRGQSSLLNVRVQRAVDKRPCTGLPDLEAMLDVYLHIAVSAEKHELSLLVLRKGSWSSVMGSSLSMTISICFRNPGGEVNFRSFPRQRQKEKWICKPLVFCFYLVRVTLFFFSRTLLCILIAKKILHWNNGEIMKAYCKNTKWSSEADLHTCGLVVWIECIM